MKNRLILALSLLCAGAVHAVDLLAPQAGDLTPAALQAPHAGQSLWPAVAHDPVALSWIAHGEMTAPAAPFAQSRESYAEVTADQLGKGVTIHTTAPHALVRIQPIGDTPDPRAVRAVDPAQMVIADTSGKRYANANGMQMLASADRVAKADLTFAPGTTAFRLDPSLGSGEFTLSADGLAGAQRFLINVAEPDSPYVLTLRADAPHYLHGAQLVLTPELREQDMRHAIGKIEGVVVSPAGRSFPLRFQSGPNGALRATLPLDADETPAPGLWEARATASAVVRGQKLERSIRVAFGVAMPLARLEHSANVAATANGLGVTLGVDAASAGRYEVRAQVFGTVNGAPTLLGVVDAAQWMEAGQRGIQLDIGKDLLSGASAPFELRDVMLIEQGRMAVLQRQQRALVLEATDLPRELTIAASSAAPQRTKAAPSLR